MIPVATKFMAMTKIYFITVMIANTLFLRKIFIFILMFAQSLVKFFPYWESFLFPKLLNKA